MRRTAWRASRLAGRRAGHTQSPCIGDGVAHYSGDLLIWLYDIHLLAQAMSPAQWDEFLRLGFLDGWQGFASHFLRGFWYRFLVDVKVHELETLMRVQGLTLEEAVRREFGYEI